MDILKVEGVGRVSGEYECDIVALIDISSDDALTVREAQFVREFSGARGGEIAEGFLAGDALVRSALAMVILKRNDKPLLETTVMDLKSGWAMFQLDVAAEESVPPTTEGATPSQNGGTSSETSSENREEDPKLIGAPA